MYHSININAAPVGVLAALHPATERNKPRTEFSGGQLIASTRRYP